MSKAFFPNDDPTTSLLLTFGTFGLSYLAPKISVLMSISLTSTSRRGRSWNFRNPSRLARRVSLLKEPSVMNV